MDRNKALSVSQLNECIKMMFDSSPIFRNVLVKGEISNFTHHRTGHLYFSLKDPDSVISAVMFFGNAQSLKFEPENGMKVILSGKVSSFVRDGKYQIYVDSMEPDGVGSLYLAFEQLKEKLDKEGLFDPAFKKPLPKIPNRVGVITSPTGAAVRDIINITGRRFPQAKIILYPALVQGDGAVDSLMAGLDYFDKEGNVDVIIIGRGGGSIEDLWAFNNEGLARKIFSCQTPIISAVGHETDYTICDFVADMRAPTPSGAAELAVPEIETLKNQLSNVKVRLAQSLERKIENYRSELEILKKNKMLQSPLSPIEEKRMTLISLETSLNNNFDRYLLDKKNLFVALSSKLDALSPLSVLSRGYSMTKDKNGKIVKSIKEIKTGEDIIVTVNDGKINAQVISTNK